jgi:hypothetical protein
VRDLYDDVVVALLLGRGPVPLDHLYGATRHDQTAVDATLRDLAADGSITLDDDAACWRAYTLTSREELAAASHDLQPDDEPVTILQDYLTREYEPPAHVRYLAIYQCSARRPFSSSPSHGAINHAVVAATGLHPWRDRETCPVHVVVLAAKCGPMPYDLQDVYPACIRAEGLAQLDAEEYAERRAVLARYMAGYLRAHAGRYAGIATFTSGRWGDVMDAAKQAAGLDVEILPRAEGATLTRLGSSAPHTYWQKHWIQLALAIMDWLPADERRAAEQRLADMGAEWTV